MNKAAWIFSTACLATGYGFGLWLPPAAGTLANTPNGRIAEARQPDGSISRRLDEIKSSLDALAFRSAPLRRSTASNIDSSKAKSPAKPDNGAVAGEWLYEFKAALSQQKVEIISAVENMAQGREPSLTTAGGGCAGASKEEIMVYESYRDKLLQEGKKVDFKELLKDENLRRMHPRHVNLLLTELGKNNLIDAAPPQENERE